MAQRGSISDIGLLKERFEWDRKFFKIYTDFRPNLRASHLTPKFYARHEGIESFDDVDPETLKLIMDYNADGPRERLQYPETENQRYGWYQPTELIDKTDRRLNSHRIGTNDIKITAEIKKHLVKDPPFTGVPFKL